MDKAVVRKTTERFRAGAKGGMLKLVAVEAFAEMWLMLRLAAFRCAHPEIVIEFETGHVPGVGLPSVLDDGPGA